MGSLTRYFPGGVATEVAPQSFGVPSVSPGQFNAPSFGGLPDFSGVLRQRMAIEAERERRAAQVQALQLAAMRQGLSRGRSDQSFDENERFRSGLAQDSAARFGGNVQDLQLRGMQAEQQAMSSPQPLRMVGGPGVVPGYAPDTLAMNAYQRKAFLPDNSGMTGVGALDDSERQERNADSFGQFQRESLFRRRLDSAGGY